MKIMNHLIKSALFLILIAWMVSFSCCTKEKNPAKQISGNYSFVTTAATWTAEPSSIDTTISFNGSITEESNHSVIISYSSKITNGRFFVMGTIYPEINDDQTFSYPYYSKSPNFFSGHVLDDGTIQITLGSATMGEGWSNYITGKKY
jgi:hypothetical protein